MGKGLKTCNPKIKTNRKPTPIDIPQFGECIPPEHLLLVLVLYQSQIKCFLMVSLELWHMGIQTMHFECVGILLYLQRSAYFNFTYICGSNPSPRLTFLSQGCKKENPTLIYSWNAQICFAEWNHTPNMHDAGEWMACMLKSNIWRKWLQPQLGNWQAPHTNHMIHLRQEAGA